MSAGDYKIPKCYENQTVFILGGGPSVISQFGIPNSLVKAVQAGELPMSAYSEYMHVLHNKNVIGVNAAFQLGDWIDCVYFLDKDFMLTYRNLLANFPNPIYSPLNYSELENYVTTLHGSRHIGISTEPNTVSYNFNSGAGAINLAYQMGAKRVVLIGFDMKSSGKKQHFHGAYLNSKLVRPDAESMNYARHRAVFPDIAKDAEKLGLEILNTSMRSALTEFKKIKLEDVLFILEEE